MTIKEFEIQLALGSLTANMRVELANNSSTPVEVLAKLSTDEDWYVRRRVAENPSTPIEILTKLSTDMIISIRCIVAENPNTSKEVLTILSKDKDWRVRYAAKTLESF